jgi:hypothetical protein
MDLRACQNSNISKAQSLYVLRRQSAAATALYEVFPPRL